MTAFTWDRWMLCTAAATLLGMIASPVTVAMFTLNLEHAGVLSVFECLLWHPHSICHIDDVMAECIWKSQWMIEARTQSIFPGSTYDFPCRWVVASCSTVGTEPQAYLWKTKRLNPRKFLEDWVLYPIVLACDTARNEVRPVHCSSRSWQNTICGRATEHLWYLNIRFHPEVGRWIGNHIHKVNNSRANMTHYGISAVLNYDSCKYKGTHLSTRREGNKWRPTCSCHPMWIRLWF